MAGRLRTMFQSKRRRVRHRVQKHRERNIGTALGWKRFVERHNRRIKRR